MKTLRSKRRKAAKSNSHGAFVVASTTTSDSLEPSKSNCLRNSVFILRSASFSFPVLLRTIESISSKIIIEGLFSAANSNKSLTLFSLSPINLEVISDDETQKHFPDISAQIAYAISVFPTPGGP